MPKQAAPPNLQSLFERLVAEWKAGAPPSSAMEQLAMHPAYQRIIGLGPDVLPYLFRELENAPDCWFWALRAITRENPVPPEHRGNIKLMACDWLEWAHQHGYKW